MSKFKVGDRVRCINGNGFHANKGDTGVIVTGDSGLPWVRWDKEDGCSLRGGCSIDHEYLDFVTPSLDNLQVDDVVVNDSGYEYTVGAVVGPIIFLVDNDGHANGYHTAKELKDL